MKTTFCFGKLVVTTTFQGSGAPLMDKSTVVSYEDNRKENWRARGIAILLYPWRRNRYFESVPQTALVLAWKQ